MDQGKSNNFVKYGKNTILALQHTFAMIGATILVPMLTNLSVSLTLLSAGVGTLLFYFITKRKVPVFLGSSFAFVTAIMSVMIPGGVKPEIGSELWLTQLGKLSVGIIFAALVYVAMAIAVKVFGVERIKKLFPPIVIGPVIIVIGLNLAPTVFGAYIQGAYESFGKGNVWLVAIITALVIVILSSFIKKGFLNSTAVLWGMVIGYIAALAVGMISFEPVKNADWIIFQEGSRSLFSFYKHMQFDASVVMLFVPVALVTCMEHIGDISANSVIVGKDFMVDPGLHRTLLGDGVATMAAGFLGGPPNTTYGENTAVLAITKNYNPNIIALAGVFAVIMGVFGKIGGFIGTIPTPVMAGASMILFGMIAANGVKVIVDAGLDFKKPRYSIIASFILVIGVGMSGANMTLSVGDFQFSPLAIATVVGVVLNLLFEIATKLIGEGEDRDKLEIEEEKYFDLKG